MISWTTVIWSMTAAACLTMALPHLLIAIRQPRGRVHWCFALTGLAVAWLAAAEFSVMHAKTPAESGRMLQLAQVPTFLVVIMMIGFVQLYFGTGRPWLAVPAIALRAVALSANFLIPPNMNFREITALRSYRFLGETLTMPVGPRSPWILLGYLSSLFLLAFVIDASWTLWQRGRPDDRRRAVRVGGSIVFFIIAAQSVTMLVNAGLISWPYSVSFPFMAIVMAMGLELGYELMRAAQVSRALREGEERMSLAAESARLSLWEWDVARDEVWMTGVGRTLLGFKPDARIDFESLVERVHPEDRAARERALRQAVENRSAYEMEYRILLPDGSVRWMAARGRCADADDGEGTRLLGVSMDITPQKAAAAETQQLRDELAHVSRVTTMSELSGSIAHELNQPLTSILSNAQAAQRFLAHSPPDLAEVAEILADIVAENRRASHVINRLRALIKRGEVVRTPVSMTETIEEVLRLTRSDLIARGVVVARAPTEDVLQVQGDRVQLQQVLLNLILNGADAMSANAPGTRRLHLAARQRDGAVRVTVRDEGCGLPGDAEKLFTPFFTTKPHGLGLGLAICRSIVTAHHGRLWGESHPGGGALFHVEIPAMPA